MLIAPKMEQIAMIRSVAVARSRLKRTTKIPPEPMPSSASPMTRYV